MRAARRHRHAPPVSFIPTDWPSRPDAQRSVVRDRCLEIEARDPAAVVQLRAVAARHSQAHPWQLAFVRADVARAADIPPVHPREYKDVFVLAERLTVRELFVRLESAAQTNKLIVGGMESGVGTLAGHWNAWNVGSMTTYAEWPCLWTYTDILHGGWKLGLEPIMKPGLPQHRDIADLIRDVSMFEPFNGFGDARWPALHVIAWDQRGRISSVRRVGAKVEVKVDAREQGLHLTGGIRCELGAQPVDMPATETSVVPVGSLGEPRDAKLALVLADGDRVDLVEADVSVLRRRPHFDGTIESTFPELVRTAEPIRWRAPGDPPTHAHSGNVHTTPEGERVVVDAGNSREWRVYHLDEIETVDEFNQTEQEREAAAPKSSTTAPAAEPASPPPVAKARFNKRRRGRRVFISYRRSVDSSFAQQTAGELERRGFKIELDVDNTAAGPFEAQLQQRIEAADGFVLIIGHRTFAEARDTDWILWEVGVARNRGDLPIIPLLAEGVDIKTVHLPPELDDLRKHQAVEMNGSYRSAAFDRLAKMLRGTRRPVPTWLFVAISIAVVAVLVALVIRYSLSAFDDKPIHKALHPGAPVPSDVRRALSKAVCARDPKTGGFSRCEFDTIADCGGFDVICTSRPSQFACFFHPGPRLECFDDKSACDFAREKALRTEAAGPCVQFGEGVIR
jgi:hypothetical protein